MSPREVLSSAARKSWPPRVVVILVATARAAAVLATARCSARQRGAAQVVARGERSARPSNTSAALTPVFAPSGPHPRRPDLLAGRRTHYGSLRGAIRDYLCISLP